MNEEEFKECSVVAYPHEIRFLHIKGGRISYYVDRHISDYVNKLQEENHQLKKQLQQKENHQLKKQLQQKEDIINKAKEYIEPKLNMKNKDGVSFLLFKRSHVEKILDILDNKGE